MSEWIYLVPASAFAALEMQVPGEFRSVLFDRIRIEIHADLTRRLKTNAGPGGIPIGLLDGRIDSYVTPQGIQLVGPDEVWDKKSDRTTGKLSMAPRKTWWTQILQASGPEWVYPGMAAGGHIKAAVDLVLSRGQVLVEELLSL